MTPVRKSYFAPSIEAAMAQAVRELGEDALVVETRQAPPADGRRGGYEVVAAAPAPERQAGSAAPSLDALAADVASLKRHLMQLAAMLERRPAPAGVAPYPELAPLAAKLAAADFPGSLAAEILAAVACRLRLSPQSRAASEAAIAGALWAELEERVKTNGTLGRPGQGRRVVVLIGPPGAGKTTTLVKLAMRTAVAESRPALILSADHHRIAAAEQLRSCAAILGLPFGEVAAPLALGRALAEHRHKDPIFVDTPGLSPQEPALAEEWAALLRLCPELDVHLVLAATTRTGDILGRMEWWDRFNAARLVFTHLDETSCPGGVTAIAAATGKPVSFLAGGQSVPEDLEEATLTRLCSFLPMDIAGARAAAA
jgi:flagellar biosynthesis protein FlhF